MTSVPTEKGNPMIKEIIYAWDSAVPKVDYVGELVRCKECKYDGHCTWSESGDWYCADGERATNMPTCGEEGCSVG